VNDSGFTLIEALVALAILGIAMVGVLPAFQTYKDANTLSEEHSNALAAGQTVMEALRQVQPASLPTSGSSTTQTVSAGEHDYEVVAHYCRESLYCTATSRHIVVEVSFAGETIYELETVYTRLN
jgi:general secretion pathway protein I